MLATLDNMLGVGIYTPSEAAFYARLTTATLARWVHGDRTAAPVIRPQKPGDPDRIVTFLDFVQALAIRAIRSEKKVPLQKIRDAIETARDTYGVEHPFAMPHMTYLLGKDILIEIPDRDDLVQISGRHRKQLVIRQVAELYMESLSFGHDRLAASYEAFAYKDLKVVMDPQRKLGKPFLPKCGYTADALVNAYRAEGSPKDAADALGIDVADVNLAIRYFDFLRGSLAA
jgi:uncharacterized protein (DUF433 family)